MGTVKTVFSGKCVALYKHVVTRSWAGLSSSKVAKIFNPYRKQRNKLRGFIPQANYIPTERTPLSG
jgi:hypothetical protein